MVKVDDNNKVIECYPGRVKFRGFPEECNDQGYERVARFMKDNAEELYDEADYDE